MATFYPIVPESNWWTLRAQFQKTMPGQITTSYIKSLLGFGSDGAAANLLASLKRIGLVDEDGKPTPRLNDWRSDTKYKETCQRIIADVYQQELIDLYSGPDIDRSAVKEWFMHKAAIGESAAQKYSSLYLLLNDGELKSSEGLKKPRTKPQTNGVKPARVPKTVVGEMAEVQPQINIDSPIGQQNLNSTHQPTLHIDLQIHISPEASTEQIEAIFSSMAKHLYK